MASPTSPPLAAAPTDEYAGQGGSFLLDPLTGVRVRIEAPTAAPIPGVLGTRPDDAEPGVQIDGQGLPPTADANASALTHSEG